MTVPDRAAPRPSLLARVHGRLDRIPPALPLLLLRLAPAWAFWASGRTKVDGWRIAESTWFLFEHEYALPVIPASWAAVMATLAEHALPVLLVPGLLTRLSALGLLAMTAVIQVFVYPDAWPVHLFWAACLLMLVRMGPGAWSLDRAWRLD